MQAIFPDREVMIGSGFQIYTHLHPISLECDDHNYRLARGRNSAFMDSCQLIRKETEMEVVHLNQGVRWPTPSAAEALALASEFTPISVPTEKAVVRKNPQEPSLVRGRTKK